MIASDFSFHKRGVSRGMVSTAVVLVSRVGNHVVLRIHILVLKVGPPHFSAIPMYYFLYQYVVTLHFVSSAAFRCKACSFPEYLTPKASTTKVKFIG